MLNDLQANWEPFRVDCPSTVVPTKITILRGGESITLKSTAGDGDSHFIGKDKRVNSNFGYELEGGETLTLALPIEFGVEKYIEIWALPSNAGDDICYAKLIDRYPKTFGGN